MLKKKIAIWLIHKTGYRDQITQIHYLKKSKILKCIDLFFIYVIAFIQVLFVYINICRKV